MGILGGILGDLISPVKDLVSEVIVDKDKARELNVRLEELADKADERYHEQLMGQVEVNKVEAAHPSIFVAGWRPAIGWIGAGGLGYTFLMAPILEFLGKLTGLYTESMPVLETEYLMTLVTSMLGVAAMRSYDKKQGTDYLNVGKGRKK